METAFIEFLDQLYKEGYGETFREDNPDAFYKQLAEFENLYHIPKHEKLRFNHNYPYRG